MNRITPPKPEATPQRSSSEGESWPRKEGTEGQGRKSPGKELAAGLNGTVPRRPKTPIVPEVKGLSLELETSIPTTTLARQHMAVTQWVQELREGCCEGRELTQAGHAHSSATRPPCLPGVLSRQRWHRGSAVTSLGPSARVSTARVLQNTPFLLDDPVSERSWEGTMTSGPKRTVMGNQESSGVRGPQGGQGGCPRAAPRNPHLLCSLGTLFCDVESTFLTKYPVLIHQPGHLTLSCPSLNPLSQHLLQPFFKCHRSSTHSIPPKPKPFMRTPFVLCPGSPSRVEGRARHPGPSPSRSRLAGSLPLARPGNHGCLPHGPPRPPHPFLSSSRKWWSSSETPFRRCPDPSLVPPQEEAHTGWMSDRDMTWCTIRYRSTFTTPVPAITMPPAPPLPPHHHHSHHYANTSLPLSPIATSRPTIIHLPVAPLHATTVPITINLSTINTHACPSTTQPPSFITTLSHHHCAITTHSAL